MKAVTYLRVSTSKQGVSGLGLAAQKASVQNYVSSHGFDVVAEFVEIESGTSKGKRVEIYRAIELCKTTGATLLIAKLDRLSRNAAFVLSLQESGINFVCVDMPSATPLTIGIIALIAQEEARLISERTKSALVAAKNRGIKLGSPIAMSESVREKGRAVIKEQADNAYGQVQGYIFSLRENGKGLSEIAFELNKSGYRTRQNKLFGPVQVSRILERFG